MLNVRLARILCASCPPFISNRDSTYEYACRKFRLSLIFCVNVKSAVVKPLGTDEQRTKFILWGKGVRRGGYKFTREIKLRLFACTESY